MSSELELVDSSDEFVCATWRSAIIYVFHARLNIPTLRRITLVHEGLKKRYPIQTVSVGIAVANVGLPDAETRKFSTQLVKDRPPEEVISAVVMEGSGMWAAAVRALITGIFLAAGNQRVNKVFAQPEECAAWAGMMAQPRLPVAAFAEAIKTVRAMKPGPLAKA